MDVRLLGSVGWVVNDQVPTLHVLRFGDRDAVAGICRDIRREDVFLTAIQTNRSLRESLARRPIGAKAIRHCDWKRGSAIGANDLGVRAQDGDGHRSRRNDKRLGYIRTEPEGHSVANANPENARSQPDSKRTPKADVQGPFQYHD